jgi:hypothetical protein
VKIAAVLNVHDNTFLALDTIDSIQTWVTNDIVVVVDGEAWNSWGKYAFLPCKIKGFHHGASRNPYKNVAYGLSTLADKYDADWYLYTEFDTLFLSDQFKEDLEKAEQENIWYIASDLKQTNQDLPLIEQILKIKLKQVWKNLGCCLFFHKNYINKLKELNFFDRLLTWTSSFSKDHVPGINPLFYHDISEYIYPSLALHYGGNLLNISTWEDNSKSWLRDKRYALRFRPDIEECPDDAIIVHPIKKLDNPIRQQAKKDRECKRNTILTIQS